MRKEIRIPVSMLPALKALAFKADKSVKRLMETVVIAYIKANTDTAHFPK